jgi:hypothetical protein
LGVCAAADKDAVAAAVATPKTKLRLFEMVMLNSWIEALVLSLAHEVFVNRQHNRLASLT